METVLEGCEQRDVVIRVRPSLWALHSGQQIGHYFPIPLSTSDGDTGSCSAAQTVVTGTVDDVRKDPWGNPGDKTKSIPVDGGGLQCNQQNHIRCPNDE